MAVTDTSLVTMWVMTTLASITGGSYCDADWSYHNLTGSCMKIFNERQENWNNANMKCGEYKTNRGVGHLVYIYNNDTDNFVKALLNQQGVGSALIGLNNRQGKYNYFWDETSKPLGWYTGWKSGTAPADDRDKTSVTISKVGWEKYDTNSNHSPFICQVDAEFPPPFIQCPVAEVGLESPSMECKIQLSHDAMFKQLSFESRETIIYCNNSKCNQSSWYTASIKMSQQTGNISYTSSLRINPVAISDNTLWRCTVELENVTTKLTDECHMKVYSPPEKPTCSHEFTRFSVVVTCTTMKVYPQAACKLYVNEGAVHQSHVSESHQTRMGGYYRTDCVLTYNPHVYQAGRYRFNVTMFPNITEPGFSQDRAMSNVSWSIYIETLQNSPEFIIPHQTGQNLTLNGRENQTMDITCRVTGGTPPVYQTYITCPGGVSRSALSWNVTVNIRLTRIMNSQFCYCSADHILPYTMTASLQLTVYFPPQITTLEVNNKKDGTVEIKSGETMKLKCSAEGNPAPNVTLSREHGGNIRSTYWYPISSVGTVTHSTTARCSDTGTYRCIARNSYNTSSSDASYINVRVRCPPEHCDSWITNQTFGVPVNTDITVRMCVLVYPEPTNFILNRETNQMSRERYRAIFNYTNPAKNEGEIILNIYAFKQEDLGAYTLTSYTTGSIHSRLKFHLIAQGPAACPTEFFVENVTTNSLILSWRPGFDGGRPQTFVLVRFLGHNVTLFPRTDLVILEKVNHSNEARLSYNVTGLSASTFYEFGIDVENDLNITKCPEIRANGTTQGFPIADSSVTNIVVAVVVILCLIVLVIIAVIFLLRRQRQSRKNDLDAPAVHNVLTLVERPHTSNNNDRDNEKKKGGITKLSLLSKLTPRIKSLQHTEEQHDDANGATYAQVNKKGKKVSKLTPKKKSLQHNDEQHDDASDNTYAQVIKKKEKKDAPAVDKVPALVEQPHTSNNNDRDNKKKGNIAKLSLLPKLTPKKKSQQHNNEQHDDAGDNTYAQVIKKKEKKGGRTTTEKDRECVYNNERDLYSNVSVAGAGSAGRSTDDINLYTNAPSLDKKLTDKKNNEDKSSGRTFNEDGLVYVSVEINKETKNPEIVSEKKVALKPRKNIPEPVEYVTVDYTATAQGKP